MKTLSKTAEQHCVAVLHYLAKRETQKLHFSLAVLLHCQKSEFNQLMLDFFNLFDSRLIFMLLYDSLNLVTNAFSLGLLWGMVQNKGSLERCSSWTTLCLRKKDTTQPPSIISTIVVKFQ